MAASVWLYFVPYDVDTSAALDRLRREVFRHGDFLLLDDRILGSAADERIGAGEDPAVVEADLFAQHSDLPQPGSIEELLEWNRESGTHSILDITSGVATVPTLRTVSPLLDAELHATFGTTMPTHDQIEAWLEDGFPIEEFRACWQGLYIVVYDGDTPAELCFVGLSGD